MSIRNENSRDDSSLLHLVRPAPRKVGRYDICFELAAGGMATIYLARIEGPGGFKKLVALKCIHPHLVRQASFVEMFLDEARFASRIHHPNVCSIFDFGFADGSYYIAMEFVVGETVSRLCRTVEQHQVAVDRVELGERTVDLLAVLLDADPAVEPRVPLAGERQ